jgi:hypothetical protein
MGSGENCSHGLPRTWAKQWPPNLKDVSGVSE